jgi:hypothetical protein
VISFAAILTNVSQVVDIQLGQQYLTHGIYRVRLRIRSNATGCESVDE